MHFHPLCEHISNVLKRKVCQNKRDEWVVEIPDQDDREYRYKRGANELVEKSKEEIHASKKKDHISDVAPFGVHSEFLMNANGVLVSSRCRLCLRLFHVEF